MPQKKQHNVPADKTFYLRRKDTHGPLAGRFKTECHIVASIGHMVKVKFVSDGFEAVLPTMVIRSNQRKRNG